MTDTSIRPNLIRLAALSIVLLATSLGCSLGRILVGDPTPTPTAIPPTPLPTWTPLPPDQLSPAMIATLTVQAALAWPTLTPTPTPFPTDTPTFLPTPTPFSETPTPEIPLTPTPFILVENELVNLRDGPSIAYPIVGEARAGDTFTVIGRNDPATWWNICCYNGREVWISAQVVVPVGDMQEVVVIGAPEPPVTLPATLPPPSPGETPQPTPTPQPYWPFSIGDGPQYFPSTNAWLTIWVKAFSGQPPIFLPVEGYRLRVLRNGVDVSKPDATRSVFELSAPFLPESPAAYGSRREYNLKYEYLPAAGDARWEIYLTDRNGAQLSPPVVFETKESDPLREVYVGFYDNR